MLGKTGARSNVPLVWLIAMVVVTICSSSRRVLELAIITCLFRKRNKHVKYSFLDEAWVLPSS